MDPESAGHPTVCVTVTEALPISVPVPCLVHPLLLCPRCYRASVV